MGVQSSRIYPPRESGSIDGSSRYGSGGMNSGMTAILTALNNRKNRETKVGIERMRGMNRRQDQQDQDQRRMSLERMKEQFRAKHQKKSGKKVPIPSDIMAAALRSGKIPHAAKNIKDRKGNLTPMSQFFAGMSPKEEDNFLAGNADKYGYVPHEQIKDEEAPAATPQSGGLLGNFFRGNGGGEAAPAAARVLQTYKPADNLETEPEEETA